MQFAVVADCSGFGPSKVPPLTMIKNAFHVMQHYYPMRLGYVLVVHASSPITFVWKVRLESARRISFARVVLPRRMRCSCWSWILARRPKAIV